MSTLYFPQNHTLTAQELRQAPRPEALSVYPTLPPSLQSALIFAWQWVQGASTFEVSTSGSTGSPQVVRATRQRMMVSIEMTRQALNLGQQHTALLCISAEFIGGKMMLARALHLGMNVVCVPPSAHPLRSLPLRPNFLAMVPLQLQSVLEDSANHLTDTHATIIGGAPVSLALEEAVRDRISAPVYSTYGMTETLSHVALRRLNGSLASDHFSVLGDIAIAVDARGCLKLKGGITNGQWLVTNDLVALRDERHFLWQGRHDWVINSGGVKVSPERVEPVIEKHLLNWLPRPLPRFLVAGRPDTPLGERVVLLIETTDRLTLPSDWQDRLATDLPQYHGPKEVHYIATFAETDSGKVDRRATLAGLR